MLFDFLKKYGRQKKFKNHIVDFRDRFSDNQRKAIMISLVIIANSDDEFHQKEEDLFVKVSEKLGYPLEEDFIDEFFKMDRHEVSVILNSLDDDQKEWYILTLFTMIHVDGKPLDVEFNYARPFLEKMGIDQSQLEKVIKSSRLWRKSPPKDLLG